MDRELSTSREHVRDLLALRIEAAAAHLATLAEDTAPIDSIEATSETTRVVARYHFDPNDELLSRWTEPIFVELRYTQPMEHPQHSERVTQGYRYTNTRGQWEAFELIGDSPFTEPMAWKVRLGEYHCDELEDAVGGATELLARHHVTEVGRNTLSLRLAAALPLAKRIITNLGFSLHNHATREVVQQIESQSLYERPPEGASRDLVDWVEDFIVESECLGVHETQFTASGSTCRIVQTVDDQLEQLVYRPQPEAGVNGPISREFDIKRENDGFYVTEWLLSIDGQSQQRYCVEERRPLEFGLACDIMVMLEDAEQDTTHE
ncbi:hypothetical protein KC973_00590 [Candidatus Saccharibacteria bacterium]|nr:hypothetical protein [Candidatus Saccharibacteria bacterium]